MCWTVCRAAIWQQLAWLTPYACNSKEYSPVWHLLSHSFWLGLKHSKATFRTSSSNLFKPVLSSKHHISVLSSKKQPLHGESPAAHSPSRLFGRLAKEPCRDIPLKSGKKSKGVHVFFPRNDIMTCIYSMDIHKLYNYIIVLQLYLLLIHLITQFLLWSLAKLHPSSCTPVKFRRERGQLVGEKGFAFLQHFASHLKADLGSQLVASQRRLGPQRGP